MSTPTSSLIETYDVTPAGNVLRDFFRCLSELVELIPYTKPNGNIWVPHVTFQSAHLNRELGEELEKQLPREVALSLKKLSLGELPNVIVLKGLPVGEPGDQLPEKNTPLSALSLRAVSALLVKRDDEWGKAEFASIFNYESNNTAHKQLMHHDYPSLIDGEAYTDRFPLTKQNYSALHFLHTDSATPTWFTPYNRADAEEFPDPKRHIPVIAKSGDMVIFNNLRVLHARGQPPHVDGESIHILPQRHFIGINSRTPYEPLGAKASKLAHLALA